MNCVPYFHCNQERFLAAPTDNFIVIISSIVNSGSISIETQTLLFLLGRFKYEIKKIIGYAQ